MSSRLLNRAFGRHLSLAVILIVVVYQSLSYDSTNSFDSLKNSLVKQQKAISNRIASIRGSTQRASGRQIWASTEDEVLQEALPAPYNNYLWSFFHAVVRHNNETYRFPDLETNEILQILCFIEDLHKPDPSEPQWNVFPPTDLSFIVGIQASVQAQSDQPGGKARVVNCRLEYLARNFGLHLFCPVGGASGLRLSDSTAVIDLNLHLQGLDAPFRQAIHMARRSLPPHVGKNQMAICTSPIHEGFNHWFDGNANQALLPVEHIFQWREHHRKLGIETVHYYSRGQDFEAFVSNYNAFRGTRDTFHYAKPVSTKTYRNDILMDRGEYGDQFLYEQDCVLRSLGTHPTDWLAMTDLDEYFIPYPHSDQPFDSLQLSQVFENQANVTGAVCLSRYQTGGPAIQGLKGVPDEADYPFANLQTVKQPEEIHVDNFKCIYRKNAVETAFHHEVVRLQPGYSTFREPTFADLHLIHTGRRFGAGPFEDRYHVTEALRQHLGSVYVDAQAASKRVNWPCSTVPCAG